MIPRSRLTAWCGTPTRPTATSASSIPATGKITDIATPTPGSGPHGIDVAPDGMIYYTAQSRGIIGRVDPNTNVVTEFRLPSDVANPHTPLVYRNRVWFTAQSNNTYGELDPATGAVRTFRCPTAGSLPYGLRAAPNGYLWIALFGTNKLARVDPVNGALTEFTLPAAGARPRRLEVSADGMVWYADYPRGYLGRLNPATGAVREWLSPSGASSGPYGIAVGSDGRIWYNESRANTMVGFDPQTEQFVSVRIPTSGSVVRNVSSDVANRRIWLALSGTQRIGRLDLPR